MTDDDAKDPKPGTEPGLEATYYYDPPNMTFPHGAYVAYSGNGLWIRNLQTGSVRRLARRVGAQIAWFGLFGSFPIWK